MQTPNMKYTEELDFKPEAVGFAYVHFTDSQAL